MGNVTEAFESREYFIVLFYTDSEGDVGWLPEKEIEPILKKTHHQNPATSILTLI